MLLLFFPSGIYRYADVMDLKQVQELLVNNQIDWLIHLSALLSAIGSLSNDKVLIRSTMIFFSHHLGEQNVPLAMKLNIEGTHHILELARKYKCRVFIPSTIGQLNSFFFSRQSIDYFQVHLDPNHHEIQRLIFVFNVLEQFTAYRKFTPN